jgi:hypothetical protein
MRPSVTGRFDGEAAQYDASKHAKGVIMIPSHEMTRELAPAKVTVLGVAPAGPVINRVEDLYTGTENDTVTPGRNLRIYGQRLRIAGDPAVVGVWIIITGERELRVRLDDRDVVDNTPSMLTIIVPDLVPGGYYIEVVTQSTTSAKTLLKEPRTYRFEVLLTVA